MPKEKGLLEVRMLGKFELNRDGRPLTISSRPAQSLFAYLILSAGTSHRREKLAGPAFNASEAYLEFRQGEQAAGPTAARAYLDYRRGEWSGS